MSLIERYQAGFVPYSNSRFAAGIAIFVAYWVAFMVLSIYLPLDHWPRGQSSAVWGGALCLVAVATAMTTDYTRRPIVVRVLIVIGMMLLYAFALQPGYAWLGRCMDSNLSDAAHARSMAVSMNLVAGFLPIMFSIRSSRLFAKDPALPLHGDEANPGVPAGPASIHS
jgi:hypothetical protein